MQPGVTILVIDDERANVSLLKRILNRAGYDHVITTSNPREGLEICARQHPDIILLDLHMPELSGLDVLERIEDVDGWSKPYAIMLTGDVSAEARTDALSRGARDFITKPFDVTEVLLRIGNLADLRLLHKELYHNNLDLEQKVSLRTAELEQARADVINRLGMAAEFRDDDTGQHTRRVGVASATIAEAAGLDRTIVAFIERAAPLHDVGKIAIPDNILLKPGPLDEREMEIMRTHTTVGAQLLTGSHSDLLELARDIALTHHERWDGKGYPKGLAGTDIPLAGRIVALADYFDAMTHDRPYRQKRPKDRVVEIIRAERGRHFDPDLVDAFLSTCA